MSNFLYPRTITISRPGAQAGVGFQSAYAADEKANETELATAIPAGIQMRREGQKSNVGLPGDGTKPTWYVFIPKRSMAKGSILQRDIVTDDEGERYQVTANYWDSMGYRLSVEKQEA